MSGSRGDASRPTALKVPGAGPAARKPVAALAYPSARPDAPAALAKDQLIESLPELMRASGFTVAARLAKTWLDGGAAPSNGPPVVAADFDVYALPHSTDRTEVGRATASRPSRPLPVVTIDWEWYLGFERARVAVGQLIQSLHAATTWPPPGLVDVDPPLARLLRESKRRPKIEFGTGTDRTRSPPGLESPCYVGLVAGPGVGLRMPDDLDAALGRHQLRVYWSGTAARNAKQLVVRVAQFAVRIFDVYEFEDDPGGGIPLSQYLGTWSEDGLSSLVTMANHVLLTLGRERLLEIRDVPLSPNERTLRNVDFRSYRARRAASVGPGGPSRPRCVDFAITSPLRPLGVHTPPKEFVISA